MKNKSTIFLFTFLPFTLISQNIQINRINIDPGANTYQLDDLNGDGLPDIISTGMFWDLEIFLNKGNFKFQYIDVDGDPGRTETFSNQAGFVDFDKDGDKDLVHTNCQACGDNGVNLYLNDNFKSFPKHLTIAPNPGSSVIYDAYDINKDGYEDLIVSGTKTTYYLNDAGKGFKTGVTLTPNAVLDYLHHQDLNGDGFVDLMARSSKDVYTFINNAGTLAMGNKLTNYDLSGYVSAKDLNGDGILDYYTSFNYCLKAMLSNKSKAELFDPLTTILCANNTETKHDLVDIDGDGDFDIIHGKTSGEGIYFKRKIANGYETSKLLNHAGFQHAFYITADFNNDGIDDILVKDKGTMLGIFANAYNEANLPLHIVGEMARDFQLGDLDGDGQQDVVSYYDEWIGVNYVKNKSFTAMVTLYRTEAKTDVYEVVIYDIDKDGDNDIIAALNPDVALGTKPSLIWLENQNNSFTKVNTILTNQRDIEDIAIGDFDKDGDIDLVLTRGISAGIYLKNNGNGSYASNPFYGTGRETMVIDFNKDGFDDVLSWRSNGDIIYYSENDKAGGFKTRKNLGAFDLIHDVEVFDFDGDGDYDLLANGYENFQSQLVLLYNDNFTFTNSKLITNNYTGTCLELSFENGLSKPTVITGGYLDLYKYQGNGNFDFVAGATPYYTYIIFKPLAIDGVSHLMAIGGENNGYLIDVEGILVSRLTSSFEFAEYELKAFPNPTKDRIHIVCEAFIGATVIDASGNRMLESKDPEISLNGLPSGLYFILVHQVGVLQVIKD